MRKGLGGRLGMLAWHFGYEEEPVAYRRGAARGAGGCAAWPPPFEWHSSRPELNLFAPPDPRT